MRNTASYIAWRYLIAKKGSTAVTFITWLSAFAMMTAVASMFVIISVFSGLEDLNKTLISDLHADLTISAAKSKVLPNLPNVKKILSQTPEIAAYSQTIEEKVYISYGKVGEIAYLRGVDSAYTKVNPINKSIFYGSYPSFDYTDEVLLESQLDDRLAIPVANGRDAATVLIPKPGKGLISKEEDIYNKKNVFVTGVFPGNDQLNNYIIAPLELSQELLAVPKNTAYNIVIKLKNADPETIKSSLQKKLGINYTIKTKDEENAAFWKMINTEKLMIYLIFTLVIFITTFNLAGAITILQLDKKVQAKALISLGLPLRSLRKIYIYTGILVVIFGIISGLLIGTLLCYIQLNTGFFKASETLAFPVKILGENYFIVALTTLVFGGAVSFIFSKINKDYIKD